jgi:hypothetical protein
MNIIKTIKRINFKSFWQLMLLGFRNPFFIYPTINATKKCLSISTKHFGRLHYQNTPANAFRHAFWNYLIAKKCTKWSKNTDNVTNWAKRITDWHENAFRNREIARQMDFHNNAVGRWIFAKHKEDTIENVIGIFLKMTANSIKITEQSILKNHQFSLVYLSE